MYGWLTAGNLNIECLGEYQEMGGYVQYSNLLNKFPEDHIFLEEHDQICFFDGYAHNKYDFLSETIQSWPEAFANAAAKDLKQCLSKLRGGFCGYTYNKNTGMMTAYVDQVSVRAMYYYIDEEKWIISNHFEYMIRVLQSNGVLYDFNPLAAKYMMTYGYMLDNSTFVKQIHRIMPGSFVKIGKGLSESVRYYFINNNEVKMTEQEAVEKIDIAFRQAIAREFDKDREYGYRHLVDLSGGLDSRMVSWVAHEMGYTDQVNMTYCQNGYWDDKISKKIAESLRHEYIFKTLDDAQWMKDIDKITSANNGAAFYMGITGGDRMLGTLNTNKFGIEHTGMLGDVILSSYYRDYKTNFARPRFGLNMYSEKLKYSFDDIILQEYPCQEMFVIYTRGILGMQSTYMIRQQYTETASPFMDVDFLETVLSVPFEYRKKHYIYLKWIKEKYPGAAEFGWETWKGVKPKRSHIFFRKVTTTKRIIYGFVCKILKIYNRDTMIPVDFWYQNNTDIQRYMAKYFKENINNKVLDKELKNDIKFLFEKGNVTEKGMALTVLAVAKKSFPEM